MFQATPHAAPRHVSGHPSRIATSTCRTHCSSRHQLSSVRLSPHSYQHLSTADTCVRLSLSLFSLRCHAGWLFANTTSVAHTDTHFLQPLTRFSRCWPRRMRLWSVICTQREICTKRDSISYSIFVFKLAIIHPHQTLHQNIHNVCILHHLYTEVCTIIREVLILLKLVWVWYWLIGHPTAVLCCGLLASWNASSTICVVTSKFLAYLWPTRSVVASSDMM